MTEIWQKGVAELGADYRAGRLDPRAVLDVCLERIARLDPSLNSVVTLDAAGARKAAIASVARWKAGAPHSALDGVPMTIKDNLLVGGLRATWGSVAYADFVPDHDEIPVERLRRAGVVIVGKTNVPELTLEGYTSNRLFGTTGNPWNPALTPAWRPVLCQRPLAPTAAALSAGRRRIRGSWGSNHRSATSPGATAFRRP